MTMTLALTGHAVRIYHSANSDPMVLDSIAGFNEIHARLSEFLQSDQRLIRLSADVSGSAEPYDELLPALEIEKTEGPVYVYLSTERALRITGGVENLRIYADFFRFRDDEEGAHHHPEYVKRPGYIKPGTLSVIIEADTAYIEELRVTDRGDR